MCCDKACIYLDKVLENYHCPYCGVLTKGLNDKEVVALDKHGDIQSLHFSDIDERLKMISEVVGFERSQTLTEKEMRRLNKRTKEETESECATNIVMSFFPRETSRIATVRCSNCKKETLMLTNREDDTLYCPLCGTLNKYQSAMRSFAKRMDALDQKNLEKSTSLFADSLDIHKRITDEDDEQEEK